MPSILSAAVISVLVFWLKVTKQAAAQPLRKNRAQRLTDQPTDKFEDDGGEAHTSVIVKHGDGFEF